MRLYLDNCCLQRPFDDQTQLRLKVETEAVFAVLAIVQAGEQSLFGSEALEYEVFRIPGETRRNEVLEVLALASERLLLTDSAEALALTFEQSGLRAIEQEPSAAASLVMMGLVIGPQHGIDPALVARPLRLHPVQHVRIDPQGKLLLSGRKYDLGLLKKALIEFRNITVINILILHGVQPLPVSSAFFQPFAQFHFRSALAHFSSPFWR